MKTVAVSAAVGVLLGVLVLAVGALAIGVAITLSIAVIVGGAIDYVRTH